MVVGKHQSCPDHCWHQRRQKKATALPKAVVITTTTLILVPKLLGNQLGPQSCIRIMRVTKLGAACTKSGRAWEVAIDSIVVADV